jgi:hypothetical protein
MYLTLYEGQAVFEAVHRQLQHSVGTSCSLTAAECLLVVSIITDSATVATSATPNTVFVSSVKLVGLLQLDIDSQPVDGARAMDAHTDRSKREVAVIESSQSGIPVVLQVTSACTTRQSEPGLATTNHHVFSCPIVRNGGRPSLPHRAEATVSVLTTAPPAQLVLSGSALCVPAL